MTQLQELCEAMGVCTKCQLSKHRTQVVPGDGPEHAEIMFIGEAPGFNEDQQGLPFVGAAGKFLDELLSSAGLQRNEVYICNVIKCRPPGNRDPLPLEIETCRPWLDQQIQLVNPKVIVTLGRYSLARYFPKESISRIHGTPRRMDGRIIFPMYHPAAALHQQSLKGAIQDDFKKLSKILKESQEVKEEEPSQQLAMF